MLLFLDVPQMACVTKSFLQLDIPVYCFQKKKINWLIARTRIKTEGWLRWREAAAERTTLALVFILLYSGIIHTLILQISSIDFSSFTQCRCSRTTSQTLGYASLWTLSHRTPHYDERPLNLVSLAVDPCLRIWCFRPVLELFSKHHTPHPYSCRSSLPCYLPDVFIAAPCFILELQSDPL